MKPQSKANRVGKPNRSPRQDRAIQRDALVLLKAIYSNEKMMFPNMGPNDYNRYIELALQSARKLRQPNG